MGVAGLALLIVGLAWFAHPRLEAELSRRVAAALTDAAHLPATVDGLRVQIFPPRLEVERVLVGAPEAPALQVESFAADLDPFRWSADVQVAKLFFEAGPLPPPASEAPPPSGPPISLPGWLPTLSMSVGELDVRAKVGDRAARLRAAGPTFVLARDLGGSRVALAGRDVLVDYGDESARFAAVDVAADIRPGVILLRRASLNGDLGTVVSEPAEGAAAKMPVQVSLALDKLARFLQLDEQLAGALQWSGTIEIGEAGFAEPKLVSAVGHLDVVDLAYGERRAKKLATDVDVRDDRVQLRKLALELDAGSVSGSADIGMTAPHALRAELAAELSDPIALSPSLREDFASGPASLRLDVIGDLTSLGGSLSGRVSQLRRVVQATPAGKAPPGLDASLSVDFRRLENGTEADGTVRVLSASGGEAGRATFDVRLFGDDLDGTAKLSVADTRTLVALIPAAGPGAIDGDIAFSGTTAAPRLSGSLLARDLVLAGTRFERIGGSFEATREALVAKPLELSVVGGAARLEGRVALDGAGSNDWKLAIEHLDLASLWIALDAAGISAPYLSGVLNGNASARGTWDAVSLDARIDGGPVSIGTERISTLALQASGQSRKWTIDGEVTRRPEEALRLSGAGVGLDSMWISIWSTPWHVAGFRALKDLPSPHGEVLLNVDLYGRPTQPLGKARLTVEDLGFGERQIGTISAGADLLATGVLELFVRDEEERLALAGSMRLEGGRPFTLTADLRDFDLAHLLAPQQSATLMSRGGARVSGRLDDLERSLDAELSLSRFEVGRNALRMSAASPVVVRARRGTVEVVSFGLTGDFGDITVRGSAGFDGSIALDVRANADARVLEAIPKSPVKWASGNASLDARIRRSRSGEVVLDGRGDLQRVSVDLGLPFLLTDANGSLLLQGSRITIDEIRGRAGGGDFSLGGDIDLERGPHLLWEVTEMNSGFLDWLQDEVSGKGEIAGTWDEIVIRGDVTVLSALYDRNVELTDLLPMFRRQLGPTPPKPGEKALGLDLHVRGPDSIFIDNNIAKAEFRADLFIKGTDLQPLLSGEVELLDGEATLFDRRFLITFGRVTFDGGPKINPALEFSANADVSTTEGDYNIVAQVSGTLDNPRVRLTSDDSSLTTNDVATLLTVGKTMNQIESEGGGVGVGDFASLAPLLYGSQLQEGAKQFLPIDRFTVEPGFSRTTGDFEPRVTVGTQLTRRLRGTLATTVAAQTQNSVQLEYQLTPTMLVIGSWESRTETSAGGFGGGVKFRYRFRYPPQFSLLPEEWRKRE